MSTEQPSEKQPSTEQPSEERAAESASEEPTATREEQPRSRRRWSKRKTVVAGVAAAAIMLAGGAAVFVGVRGAHDGPPRGGMGPAGAPGVRHAPADNLPGGQKGGGAGTLPQRQGMPDGGRMQPPGLR